MTKKIVHLISGLIIFFGCSPKNIYSDSIIKKSKDIEGFEIIEFNRHGLIYIDKRKQNRIIERSVFKDGRLIYRYPIMKESIETTLRLQSGKNTLEYGMIDTLRIEYINLPAMNKHVIAFGGAISRLDDSTYLVKAANLNSKKVTVQIRVSVNYEEIKNDKGFIADSILLNIK
jgi:hypothetical protein